jgi:beta-lactamase class A
MRITDAETAVRGVFRDAGVRGWLHARPVDGDGPRSADQEVCVGADIPVVVASVYKLVVLVAFCRAVDAGELHRRTPGPTGISALSDPVTMTWRDLATSMITVSDNAAADAVLERIGQDSVRAVIEDLRLTGTRIHGGTAEAQRSLLADTGTDDVAAAFSVLADNNVPVTVRELDPTFGSATTPRDMTRLLTVLWRGEAASPEQTRFARRLLEAQVWPHRLRAGFPGAATVAGKTGTVGAIRNEVGVITYPGEHPVAVAVFTHAARTDITVPRADAAIGAAARHAVNALRTPALGGG